MTLPAGTPIGKYVVRRKLAEGGMAEIYLATSTGPEGFEKEVVIKRIRPMHADDPGFVKMFIAEARLASRLNHANLVQIFDFDKHQDTYYLAMEYVRGKSLWELRRRTRERMLGMPPTLVAQIGLEIARGLHHAHQLTDRGEPLHLVHRDVTPHNVLLSYDGAVKLTDFGIAKAGSLATTVGMLKGKFAYMSPEQAQGLRVDARTDVFALGIVLWELLPGSRLFHGEGDVAVLRAVQESAIAPPARLNPEVDARLDAVVMRALERDLDRRWSTAQLFERALADHVRMAARSLEDTDVGAFLRQAFPQECGAAEGGAPPPRPAPAIASGSETTRQPERSATLDIETAASVQGEPVLPTTERLPARSPGPARRWPPPGRWRGAILVALLALCAGAAVVFRATARRAPGREGEKVRATPTPITERPDPPAAPTSVATPRAAPPSVAPAPATAPTGLSAPHPERGWLLVRVKPWGDCRVDRVSCGTVQGSRSIPVAPGRHLVTISRNGVSERRAVTVSAGRTTVLSFGELRPAPR